MRTIQPQFKRKDVRSYVIRSGRITPSQEKALAESWPKFGLDLHSGPTALDGAFENPAAPLMLEIGFGMGDSLLEMAQQHPQENFIGIEVHVPGVGRIVNEASRTKLNNLKVFCADANDVLSDCIPPASLQRIQIFFPDPWHKSRHHKRRLVQQGFIQLACSRLKTGGVFHMATDWLPYAESALDALAAEPMLSNLAGEGFASRPLYRPQTKFERRGLQLGHPVQDLLFVKD